MKIEIWSDVVCPWCYIGKRRMEKAIDAFEHADEVEVHWRSFQLDPARPPSPTEGTGAMLARKYGQSPEGAKQMQDRVEAVAAEDGLIYRLSETLHLNTVDAHRLIHLGHVQGGNDLQGRAEGGAAEGLLHRRPQRRRPRRAPGGRRRRRARCRLAWTRCWPAASTPPRCTPTWSRPTPTARLACRSSSWTRSTASPARSRSRRSRRCWSAPGPTPTRPSRWSGGGEECGPGGCAI